MLGTSEPCTDPPDMSPPAPSLSSQSSRPQRVLACVRCQQRKVKCDRKIPCTNCNTSRVQCVPSSLTPRGPRRRRFPERELLERLRKYEDLLRENGIRFEPLHSDLAGKKDSPNMQPGGESDEEQQEAVGMEGSSSSPSSTVKSERVYEAKNFWHALNSVSRDPEDDSDSSQDDMREIITKKGWVQLYGDNDHLLFSFPNTHVNLSTLHPKPAQIFKLWQIYLENVNPMLKVTHTPSLQGRIIEATNDLTNISSTLEALMFSIYCMAILSLFEDECQTIFGSSKEDLLLRYQFSCQKALINCGFLRSSDRDCLTALYLYLISVRPSVVPQSLSAILGVAIRIAQRMGIHSELALAKCTAFEGELRRRLWWSLVLFDSRISEMSEHKNATLAPTWDCRIPLNVNDSDLRPEMKVLPVIQGKSSDALFAVVRSELGEFIRHTLFHIEFTNPALRPIFSTAQDTHIDAELPALERMIEDKYLKFCDLENPLHFMTVWWTREYLAKHRLLEHYSRNSSSSVPQTDAQCDAVVSYALEMLQCDTRLKTSSKKFFWLTCLYFPFPAYIQILQDMKRRPRNKQSKWAWEVMSDNYEDWFDFLRKDDKSPFFTVFCKMVLQAWEAREAAFSQSTEPLMPPRIVLSIRSRMAQMAQEAHVVDAQQPDGIMRNDFDKIFMPTSLGTSSYGPLYDLGGQGGLGVNGLGVYPDIMRQAPLDVDVNNLDWNAMDWGFGPGYPGAWNMEL